MNNSCTLNIILSFLSIKENAKGREVCKEWKRALESPSVCKEITLDLFDFVVDETMIFPAGKMVFVHDSCMFENVRDYIVRNLHHITSLEIDVDGFNENGEENYFDIDLELLKNLGLFQPAMFLVESQTFLL